MSVLAAPLALSSSPLHKADNLSGVAAYSMRKRQKYPKSERHLDEEVSNWILSSCQRHRVTSERQGEKKFDSQELKLNK